MSVSKDNIRILVTVSRELKSELEAIAKQENRSVSNLIATIIKDFVKERKQ